MAFTVTQWECKALPCRQACLLKYIFSINTQKVKIWSVLKKWPLLQFSFSDSRL